MIAQVWINLHRQLVLYSDVVKEDPSPTWLRLRLFALLTAGKGNGTGVCADIFVSLILHFLDVIC